MGDIDGNCIPVYTTTICSVSTILKRRLPKWESSFNVMSLIFSKITKKLLTNQSFSDNIRMSKDKA